jgi:serine/threonine protein kinase
MAIQIGDVLGDYQVTGVLGRGGMGKVFRVRSLVTEREEAMKVVLPDLDEDPGFGDRFLREIKVHASLQHPNIAALHTALRIDGRLVMILELVEGVSLEETLRRGPVGIPTAIHYMNQLFAALAFAHERGVIHRDIKPANVLIAAGGVVKLTDFGIARSNEGKRLTGTGLAVGTPAYMSPEQIRYGQADARSDIYALGLMFYEMVTGRQPVKGDTEHSLMEAQLNVMPPDPASVNLLVPAAISDAIMRALAKDPNLRFQTMLKFQAAAMASGQAVGNSSETVVKRPELQEIETRLSRAIGPIAGRLVASAARRYGTISEIRQALASEIEDPKQREAFLKAGASNQTDPGLRSDSGAAPTYAGSSQPAPNLFDPVVLDRLTQALAPYLGPIAKIVVARAARASRSPEQLHSLLAAEISSPADRERFLSAVRFVL